MKKYQVGEELATIFLIQGFIESTSDKNDNTRIFKTSKNASHKIYFKDINLQIIDSTNIIEEQYNITENELRLLILFFKLKSSERKELTNGGIFNFTHTEKSLSTMIEELAILKKIDFRQSRQKKLIQIIDIYNSIKL